VGWNQVATYDPPLMGDESWQLATIPAVSGVKAYAVRLKVASTTPASWNVGGFFSLAQLFDAAVCHSQSHPLPLIGRGALQGLRVLSSVDWTPISSGATGLVVCWYQNKWIEAEAFEIWALT
jgi:hypothetical protein